MAQPRTHGPSPPEFVRAAEPPGKNKTVSSRSRRARSVPPITEQWGVSGVPTSNEADRQVVLEQEYVTALYARLDALREQAATWLSTARDAGADRETTALWQAELARLESVEDGLCFGRLDLRDGRRVYIGRLGLFRDEDEEPLLLDWRAPAARPFYTATMAAAHGVRRRRRITTRGRVVLALDDELLDPDTAEEGALVGEAALVAALTADRTGRMRDIVTTLQTEQDRIVPDGYAGVLVVQGGPGTGKTAVALHRLAYLLYTRPHLRTRGVLIVGPSEVFLDYIGQVLPGLGEHAVVTGTIAQLRPDVRVNRTDPPEIAEAKGRADMVDRIAAMVRSRVRGPDEPVEVEFEQQAVRLDPPECRRALAMASGTGLPHNQARLVFQQRIVELLAQRLIDRMEGVVFTDTGEVIDGGSADGRLSVADVRALAAAGVVLDPDGDEDRDAPKRLLDEVDVTHLRSALLADVAVRHVLDELWPPLTAQQVVADLFANQNKQWSTPDIPLLDEAAAMIGAEGGVTYGHVVVDEAQELSPMASRMVMRRCPTRSMTIVGDLAQTSDPAGASSWEAVLRPHVDDRWRLAQLSINYRTPAEIMTATDDLFATHHPDLRRPRSVRAAGESPWRQHTTPADLPDVVTEVVTEHTNGQLAIITPPAHRALFESTLRLPRPPTISDPVVVLTPAQAKGLEFDAVLIVDPAAILAAPLGHNDLYVAMTRATRQLGIVHPGPVPGELLRIQERKP
ncbi:HelD family protein [Actinophytocola gossypii]|uniref:AAA family ATPase n=1 Tax=Actinophytocola gossypii TaxID=2812003 RepID=A0ABT2JIQ3_9PSEU|nr:ATP-binding domain-containing protein [Actinophytocola gossypii]MCT2587768.1 AAA family ATPase [Actinophytocola gossypii]